MNSLPKSLKYEKKKEKKKSGHPQYSHIAEALHEFEGN